MRHVAWVVPAVFLASCSGEALKTKEPKEPMAGWEATVSQPEEKYGRKACIIVGIDAYEELGDLTYGVNDANLIRGILETDFAYSPSECLLLTDSNASRSSIANAFEKWLPSRRLDTSDCVVVYFSGHGAIHDGDGYVAAVDSAARVDDSWIAVDWVAEQLAGIATNRAVILDCCYSGALFRDRADSSTVGDSLAFVGLSAGRREPMVAASRGGKYSMFASSLANTLVRRARTPRDSQMFTFTELAVEVKRELERDHPMQLGPDWGVIGTGTRDFLFHPTFLTEDSKTRLVGRIMENVQPHQWARVGGPYKIGTIGSLLEVSGNSDVHAEVYAYLSELRYAWGLPEVEPPWRDEELRLQKVLGTRVSFQYVKTPLVDIVNELRVLYEVPIVINVKALSDCGFDASVPVTENIHGVPLRSALNRSLRKLELTYIVRDDCIVITTAEMAEAVPVAKYFDVRDLLEKIKEDRLEDRTTRKQDRA